MALAAARRRSGGCRGFDPNLASGAKERSIPLLKRARCPGELGIWREGDADRGKQVSARVTSPMRLATREAMASEGTDGWQ